MVKCLAPKTKTIAHDLKSSTLPLSQIKLCKAGMICEFGSYHIVNAQTSMYIYSHTI